jgi:hypothetical protein
MIKANEITLLLALTFLAVTNNLPAQGTLFTYQGSLSDGGSPANGNYDFMFGLFNNNSTNNGQVGNNLTNLNVAVTNGLFTVMLDFGANFPGASRWLAISVRTNGSANFTALNPLQELTPTPYAIYAPNAGSANSVAATNITGTIPLAQLPGAVLTNNATGVTLSGTFSGNGAGLSLPGNVQQFDPQTVFYTNLTGLNNPWLANRLDSFIKAMKAGGIYGLLNDGVLLRGNWQAGTNNMFTFFGKSVTNYNASFTGLGTWFNGSAALKFPCQLQPSNTVYCMFQNNASDELYQGILWQAYANADVANYWTYAEGLYVNVENQDEYDFFQQTDNISVNYVVPAIPSLPWATPTGVTYERPVLVDSLRHSFAVALNGATNGYSICDGQATSLTNGCSLTPSNALDTVSIGAWIVPAANVEGWANNIGNYSTLIVQYWFSFNANLTAAQVKILENALMYLDVEQHEVFDFGDSRMGNQQAANPDGSFSALLAQASLGAGTPEGTIFHRFAFPSMYPFPGSTTNFYDMIPQYINPAACPDMTCHYLFGINDPGSATNSAAAKVASETNDWAWIRSMGIKLTVIDDIQPTNFNYYPPTNIAAYDNALVTNALLYDRLLQASLAVPNMADTNLSYDGLHLTANGNALLVLASRLKY